MRKKTIRIFIFVMAMVLFGLLFTKESSKLHFLKNENKKIEKKIQELKAEKEEYKANAEAIKNDRKYLEKVLRNEFGMIKEGEKVYKFE